MAQIYPSRPSIETKSLAERRLYDVFRRGLPDDYVVFHHVAWLVRDPHSGAQDGEADFIIAHPDQGILVIEVKGGHIRYNGATGEWFSNDCLIKDPFEQAKGNKYSLLDKLKDHPYWRNRWLCIGHAVAFPDVIVKQALRLDAPDVIILDAHDLEQVHTWVKAALGYWGQQGEHNGGLGPNGIAELIRLLSPSWELHAPLAVEFAKEEEAIIRLTEEQFRVLDMLAFQRRVAISGCAGSGKTMLALEQARRLARQGFRVLLTCYNRDLAKYLRSDESLPKAIEVMHFHGLCIKMATWAGLKDRLNVDQGTPEWFNHTLPELLMDATDILEAQSDEAQRDRVKYDAVIVDEGQDFQAHWWLSLQALLYDPDRGLFYIFYDDNQNLYQTFGTLPEGLVRISLTCNCRNTQYIHRTFLPFYHSEVTPQVKGPPGRPPEIVYYTTEQALKGQLRRILHHLIFEEGVATKDIVILTPRSREKSWLWQWGPLGNLRLTDQWPPASGEVYCTTIYNYKGLESPVVILAELYPSSHQNLEALLYVGCSRARHHLCIFADEALPDEIRRRLSGVDSIHRGANGPGAFPEDGT